MRRNRASLLFSLAGFSVAAAGRAQETPPPSPPPVPHEDLRRAIHWKTFEYTCEGGAKVTVSQTGSLAKVQAMGHQYLMKQTVSADGARYSDGKVLWWGKGEGGFLQEDTPDGNGKMLVKDCKLVKPEAGETGEVSGTVIYLQRIALPPQAVIQVKLQDVSRADALADAIATQTITLGNRQVPVAFELHFDPARIDPKHSYTVSAQISVDGNVRFRNDQAYPVLTNGKPSHVEVLLRQVPGN